MEIKDETKICRKQFVADDIKIDLDEGTVTAVISTAAIDRDREVILPKGVDLEQFQKNPVVLWAHDSSGPPIGKALWIKKTPKRVTAKVQFADTEFADEIFGLFKGGFLKAFSIGFIPIKSHSPTPDEIKKRPELAEVFRVFDEIELIEFSAVPVPSNAEALAIAVKAHDLEISNQVKLSLGIEDSAEEGTATINVSVPVDVLPVEVEAVIEVRESFAATTPLINVSDLVRGRIEIAKGRI